jgi:hypothetical protein
MRRAGITVQPQQVAADSASVQALVGEVAPYRAPAPVAAPSRPAQNPRSAGARQRRHRSGDQAASTNPSSTESAQSHRARTSAARAQRPRRASRPQQSSR